MKRLNLALLAGAASLLLSVPARAHHQGHTMPMPQPKKAAPVKKKPAAARKAPAKKATAKKATAKKAARKKGPVGKSAARAASNAGDAMSTVKPDAATPAVRAEPSTQAGHQMPASPPPARPEPATPGHDMSTMPGTPTPGHDMAAMSAPGAEAAGTSLPAGNAPPPPLPTDHAADAIYGTAASEQGRHHLMKFHGGQKLTQVMFNIAEAQFRRGRDGFEWDGEGWYGGDINRLWIKSEGDGAFGRSIEKAEIQALYSRAVGPYFNVQGGVRYDFKPNPSRIYATVGFEGLAPGFFDVEGALFLSNKGELLARAEGYYDQRITQRLILQPRAELNFAAQSSREIGVGKGLSDAKIGLRLRYEIRREFAPYVGVQYRRAFGDTARYLRQAGDDPGGWELLTGIRTWF